MSRQILVRYTLRSAFTLFPCPSTPPNATQLNKGEIHTHTCSHTHKALLSTPSSPVQKLNEHDALTPSVANLLVPRHLITYEPADVQSYSLATQKKSRKPITCVQLTALLPKPPFLAPHANFTHPPFPSVTPEPPAGKPPILLLHLHLPPPASRLPPPWSPLFPFTGPSHSVYRTRSVCLLRKSPPSLITRRRPRTCRSRCARSGTPAGQ